MSHENKQYLRKLESCVPISVNGDKLSMYSIALEGWRRGLLLKFFNVKYGKRIEINYSLSSNNKEYKFAVSKGPFVTKEAMRISKDKIETKKVLAKSKVPVPLGKFFNEESSDEEIIRYAQTLGFPLVLKPSNANLGKGVIPNITDISTLKKSLIYVRKDLGYSSVIIEEHIIGEEYRIYVIGEKVIGAINRRPANITGDGKSSIRKLISEKNRIRRTNPNLRGRSIKIDNEVKKYVKASGYTLDSSLPKNELLYLRKNSNVSSGGEPIDVTDQLTDEIKTIAINAAKAVPGLVQCGIDIIINNKENSGSVIELNTRPGIGSHLYPVEGKARDIPKAIIDDYFPETNIENNHFNENIYFDFKAVTDLLRCGNAMEVVIPSISNYALYTRGVQITGKIKKAGYSRWVQRNALNLMLNGFIEEQTDGSFLVIMAGKEENVKSFENLIVSNNSFHENTKEVNRKEWKYPIQVGFEIRNVNKDIKYSNTKMENKKYDNEINEIMKKIKIVERKYNDLVHSRTWRYSAPIRRISKVLKLLGRG